MFSSRRGIPQAPLLLAVTAGLFFSSCNAPDGAKAPDTGPIVQRDSVVRAHAAKKDTAVVEQISRYIRCMFQDRDGNIWFGTTSDGVVRYDGRSLRYFQPGGSNWVNAITQDAQGDLWFATSGGVSRYDGTNFITFTTKDGLADDRVWSLLIDRSGGFWFGTQEGVSRFDGRTFTSFSIPPADLSGHPYYKDPKQINAIIQDKAGNIWFASHGGGAYRYNGSTLTNFSEKDGLCSNFVGTILEDRTGGLWFGTRFGGLCKYEVTGSDRSGQGRFTAFTRKDLLGDHVGMLYQDNSSVLWIGVTSIGLCRHDAASFTCFGEKDGAGIRVVMCMLEDTSGQLWIGTGAGVYRYDQGRFTNWTKRDALGT